MASPYSLTLAQVHQGGLPDPSSRCQFCANRIIAMPDLTCRRKTRPEFICVKNSDDGDGHVMTGYHPPLRKTRWNCRIFRDQQAPLPCYVALAFQFMALGRLEAMHACRFRGNRIAIGQFWAVKLSLGDVHRNPSRLIARAWLRREAVPLRLQ